MERHFSNSLIPLRTDRLYTTDFGKLRCPNKSRGFHGVFFMKNGLVRSRPEKRLWKLTKTTVKSDFFQTERSALITIVKV